MKDKQTLLINKVPRKTPLKSVEPNFPFQDNLLLELLEVKSKLKKNPPIVKFKRKPPPSKPKDKVETPSLTDGEAAKRISKHKSGHKRTVSTAQALSETEAGGKRRESEEEPEQEPEDKVESDTETVKGKSRGEGGGGGRDKGKDKKQAVVESEHSDAETYEGEDEQEQEQEDDEPEAEPEGDETEQDVKTADTDQSDNEDDGERKSKPVKVKAKQQDSDDEQQTQDENEGEDEGEGEDAVEPEQQEIEIVEQEPELSPEELRKLEEERKRQEHEEWVWKYKLLGKKYPNRKDIPQYTHLSDLETMKTGYKPLVRDIGMDMTSKRYMGYLKTFFFVTELVMVKFMGFKAMEGYAKNEMEDIESYNEYLVEMGDRSYSNWGKSIPVEAKLVGFAIFKLILFFVMQYIIVGGGDGKGGMLSGIFGAIPEPKMKGPSIKLGDPKFD